MQTFSVESLVIWLIIYIYIFAGWLHPRAEFKTCHSCENRHMIWEIASTFQKNTTLRTCRVWKTRIHRHKLPNWKKAWAEPWSQCFMIFFVVGAWETLTLLWGHKTSGSNGIRNGKQFLPLVEGKIHYSIILVCTLLRCTETTIKITTAWQELS